MEMAADALIQIVTASEFGPVVQVHGHDPEKTLQALESMKQHMARRPDDVRRATVMLLSALCAYGYGADPGYGRFPLSIWNVQERLTGGAAVGLLRTIYIVHADQECLVKSSGC